MELHLTKHLYNGFNAGNITGTLSYYRWRCCKSSSELQGFKASKLELVLYTTTSMGDGTQSINPWLQKLPDPITRMAWDNYVTISPADAKEFGIENELNARMQLDGTVVKSYCKWCEIRKRSCFHPARSSRRFIGLALGYGKKTQVK